MVRGRQSEAQGHLKSLLNVERTFFSEQGRWAKSFEEMGYAMEPNNRYRYALSREGEVLVVTKPDGGAHAIVSVDAEHYRPRESDAAHPPAIPLALWTTLGVQGGTLTLVATGNIDQDPTLDVWSISSDPRVIDGELVEEGVPYCHVDDSRR